MNTLTLPAPAKINLFLHVVGKRVDGYHLLESLMVLLDFGDSISLSLRTDKTITVCSPLSPLPIPTEQELCYRAARLLQERTGCPMGVAIEVQKRIPLGGGLGGGSSDAASVLLGLNSLWRLQLSRKELQKLAVTLGADVPFFVFAESALVSGIGEVLRAVSVPPLWFCLFMPQESASTAGIFADLALTHYTESRRILALCEGEGHNDLENTASQRHRSIATQLAWLRAHVSEAWLGMSGSGTCVFAAFSNETRAQALLAQLPPDMHGLIAKSLQQHPAKHLAFD